METDIIKISHLSKSFGDVKAVNDLSFQVKKGELFAFLGVNGAGKSTTISIICGQLKKDSGTVQIKEKDVEKTGKKTGRILGVVFQDSVLDKPLTVRENLKSRAALLAVSCVTVTFCVNLTMIQDRANGTRKDFNVSPVSKARLYLGYFLSTVVNSLMVNGLALVLCFGYMYKMGWYMSVADVLWVILDEILLILFGSTLSSIVSYPLTTQGQLSAVGTIVSVGYGFLCGAYMPISNFGSGLQTALSYLPSTYGTSLLKNHMLHGIFEEMAQNKLPDEMITAIRDTLDCNPQFRGSAVSTSQMLLLMTGSIVVFGIIFFFMTFLPEKEGN